MSCGLTQTDGCCLLQAYWGCEHSPEYVQLLFAVALDRLDIPSPTAPPKSDLWQLHQLVPMASLQCASTALPADSTGQDHQHVLPAAEHMPAVVDPTGSAAGPVEHMDVELAAEDGHQQPAAWAAQTSGLQAGGQQLMQQAWPPFPTAAPQLQPLQQEEQVLQGPFDPHLQQAEPHPSQQQGLQDQADPQLLQQQQQWTQEIGQQQVQQQPGQQQRELDASSPADHSCVSSELQQHAFAAQPEAMSPTDPMCLLSSPLASPLFYPMEQHGASPGGSPALEGLGDLEDLELEDLELELEESSSPAVAAAGQHQQQTDPQPQQPQDPLLQQQQQQQPAAAGGVQQLGLQEQQQQPAGDPQLPPLLPQQQYDRPMGQLDNYVGDLLDILDTGAPGEPQQQAAPTAGMTVVPEGNGQDGVHSALTDAQTGCEQSQQQHVIKVPLAVKGAVVFTLLALHESQLIYPKVPVYVPLPLLQQLACAAAEFKAASAAAADALQALQLLASGQRLLVGQFRRPNNWEPQLPADLMPGGRMPAGMGLNAAIGAAARKAARSAAKSSMQSAAVAAAARAARAAAAFDPGVHREAVFHIKSALRGLSNFSSMQSLCDQYAAARRAIFGSLLDGQHAASGTEQQCSSAVQPRHLQEPAADKEHADQAGNQGPLIVKRGGSRRKRLAAAAAPGRKGKAKGGSLAAPAPAAGPASQQPAAPAEAPAPSAPLAAGLDLPEVFDAKFASSLQDLANSEASRMLLLLDPYYSASKVRKRTAAEKQAAKAAEAAASAAAKSRLERFQRVTMSRAGARSETSTGQHEQVRSMAAAPEEQRMRQELATAGVFTEQELDDVASSSLLAVPRSGMPGMQQALQRAAQQRQEKAQVAKAWLQAEKALVLDDDDEDMP